MKTILIIENDEAILGLLHHFLCDEYIVHTSLKLLSIFEILSFRPDLIVLDHWHLDTNADELCVALKANYSTKNIPVIMMSVLPNIAQKSVADAYIVKPFDIDEFNTIIQQYTNL